MGNVEIAGSIVTLTTDIVTVIDAIEEQSGIDHKRFMEMIETAFSAKNLMSSGMSGREAAEVLLGEVVTDEEYAAKRARAEHDMNVEHEALKNKAK